MNIATYIRGVMERRGITQTRLASEAGISRTHLNRWLRGRKLIREDVLSKIMRVLDLTMATKENSHADHSQPRR